jgi:hypothetical protein
VQRERSRRIVGEGMLEERVMCEALGQEARRVSFLRVCGGQPPDLEVGNDTPPLRASRSTKLSANLDRIGLSDKLVRIRRRSDCRPEGRLLLRGVELQRRRKAREKRRRGASRRF